MARLNTCHPDLIRLFTEVIKDRDCAIICGHRTKEEQEKAYPLYSKVRWPDSKHNKVPSLAVDVMPYPILWKGFDGIREFANWVLIVAKQLNINVTWGGARKKFCDMPHYELEDV
jgi:peptidoglycan L-alanyl-D-glutamate endopeptidase CwlK